MYPQGAVASEAGQAGSGPSRMAWAKPTISSTVSPFMEGQSTPAIWDRCLPSQDFPIITPLGFGPRKRLARSCDPVGARQEWRIAHGFAGSADGIQEKLVKNYEIAKLRDSEYSNRPGSAHHFSIAVLPPTRSGRTGAAKIPLLRHSVARDVSAARGTAKD